MWRLSGIFRDVFLYSTPKVRIRDFCVRCKMDEKYENATLTVSSAPPELGLGGPAESARMRGAMASCIGSGSWPSTK